jgi:hypothetical protein
MENISNNDKKTIVQPKEMSEAYKTHALEKNIDNSMPISLKALGLAASLILAVAFDRFFFNGMPGISVFLFALLFTGIFLIFNHKDISIKRPLGIFTAFILIIVSLNYGLYSNPFMFILDFMALPMLCTGCFMAFRYENLMWGRIPFIFEILHRIFIVPLCYISKPFVMIGELINKKSLKLEGRRKSIVIGLLVSLPLLIIVIPLLSSADMIFNYYIEGIIKSLRIENFSSFIFHLILVSFVFIYVFPFMLSFKYPRRNITEAVSDNKRGFDPVAVITSLVPVNLVYLLFSIVQSSYLYGGGNMTLPQGFTYAEYARRGFFELVVVTAINFGIVILFTQVCRPKTSVQDRLLKLLLSLTVVFTLNMLFSANFKLSLYESAYGFTYLRFFVHAFILLIFLLMIFVLSGIWLRKVNIIKCCLAVSIAFFGMLNLISPDRIIAQRNIERFNDAKIIDLNYMASLSYDAVPYLAEFSKGQSMEAQEMRRMLQKRNESLEGHPMRWYEFNLSRYRAGKILKDL